MALANGRHGETWKTAVSLPHSLTVLAFLFRLAGHDSVSQKSELSFQRGRVFSCCWLSHYIWFTWKPLVTGFSCCDTLPVFSSLIARHYIKLKLHHNNLKLEAFDYKIYLWNTSLRGNVPRSSRCKQKSQLIMTLIKTHLFSCRKRQLLMVFLIPAALVIICIYSVVFWLMFLNLI